MRFKVEDRVRVIKPYDSMEIGSKGRVVYINHHSKRYGIEFDESAPYLHKCPTSSGIMCPSGRGCFVDERCLVSAKESNRYEF